RGVGLEWWRNGMMEYWSIGVLGEGNGWKRRKPWGRHRVGMEATGPSHHSTTPMLHHSIHLNSLRHIHVLQLGVAFHRGHAEVAAQAALFESAEWRFEMQA